MNDKLKVNLPVVDFHCDVLCKMQLDAQIDFSHPSLDVTKERLLEGNVQLQTFAIYISQVLGTPRFEHVVRQIELFRQHVTSISGGLRPLLWKEDLAMWKNASAVHQEEQVKQAGEEKRTEKITYLDGNGTDHIWAPWALLSLEG